MKILIDHQIFEMQKFGGISRYFYELLTEFEKIPELNISFPLIMSNNEYIKEYKNIKTIPTKEEITEIEFKNYAKGYEFKGKSFLFKKLHKDKLKQSLSQLQSVNKDAVIKELKKQDFDVFHATFYDDYFMDYLQGKPYVITVYDLITEIYPEHSLNRQKDKSQKILENASAIIAISESTKKDLIDFYDIDEQKIHVTYLASSLNSNLEVSTEFINKIPNDFILFVGNRSGYKNFYFFAQAFAKLIKKYPNLQLVCTGSPLTNEEMNYLQSLEILDKIHVFFVSDEELIYLYKHTKCFVFPSLYEGFGIPVLEALEYKSPIAVSKSSSLTEVGEDAVVYFEPKNIKSIQDAISYVLETDKNILTAKYESQLSKFNWKKTAIETVNIYENLLV